MEGGEARIVAYTKVFAIRARLDKRVRYITDGEKTSLASSITYISNPEKTEQFFFTSALNCSSVDTALSEMMETKQQFGKMGGVLGYHFIQSFQPGEVTPEQAHAIGLEFAKRLFGKRYEVVISTHLNKHHLHNHLVVNSVSCVDGQKYHSSPESYYNDVRGTSDELCRENDLSVIAPQGKGKHYAEWKAEQGGKPTVRGVIRTDIDAIIHQAYTYDIPQYARMTMVDEMDFGSLGEKKKAIFCVIPVDDSSMNYLVGMLYTQCFQALYRRADEKHNGRLPVPVRVIQDEWANVAQPESYPKILATCRSYNIGLNIIVQNIQQIKALYEKEWESIIGNCDTLLFLGGGNEPTSLEFIVKLLGKETIATRTRGQTKGRSGSSSTNFQQTGRDMP